MSFIVNLIRTSLSLVLIVATSAVSADECVPSPWGADDQIGAANRVTPERTAAAAKLVKKGISHPLGIVIEPGMPAYPPRYTQLQVVQPNQQFNADLGVGWEVSSNDDVLQMWLGTGPQLDGLGHMGEAGEFYNCNQGKDFSIITGLTKLDISGIPPMVGRGVMIDIAKQMGVDSLQAGQPITSDDIKAAMKSQGVTVGEGDVVLLHTGYTDATLKQNPSLWAGSIPGITNEASVFLAGLKPMAVGADTWGLGAVPPRAGDKIFYDHVVLLKQHGIYILETMNTGRLADEGVHEFMFVLGQARLKGAVQMIINPVAMW
ncbi:MAG: cyclase family protein [Pseudomonadota bacterium]|nr:cyclase family protein [Pseudomonadota bacterium]MEC8001401.1 cyclase family protein [Pseudomonadota bacterium]MED5539827.1 cyclase family protein [Pseudomonadota bacterium]